MSSHTEEALKFVNRVTNPKTAPSPDQRGFRKSKGQRRQEENVVKLEKKLLSSRQQVVQHLKHARTIEQNILQAELVEKQRREAVKAAQAPSSRTKVAHSIKDEHQRRGSVAIQSNLPPSLLLAIENAYRFNYGHGEAIQAALNLYDDTKMVGHLEKVPPAALDNLNPEFFAKVAILSSAAHVTRTEAIDLYGSAKRQVDYIPKDVLARSESSRQETTWSVLIKRLRKQMLVAKLAVAIYQSEHVTLSFGASMATTDRSFFSSRLSHSRSTGALPGSPVAAKGSSSSNQEGSPEGASDGATTSLTTSSSSSSSSILPPSSSFTMSNSVDIMTSTSPLHPPVGSPVRGVKYLSLRDTFMKSQEKQIQLSDRIVANISKVYKDVTVDAEKYPNASEFARRIVVRKLQDVMINTVRRILRKGFRQWASVTEVHSLQEEVRVVLKAFGTFKLHYVTEKSLGNKQYRLMDKWKQRTQWYCDTEQTAAAGELQRFWRGALLRRRLWKELKNNAIVYIQKRARGVQGRDKAQKFRIHTHRQNSCRRIEGAYMKYRWRRIRANIHVFKTQKRMTLNIQRVYRGFLGRERVRGILLRARRLRGAIKFQCLWRRFTATNLVDKKRRLLLRRRSTCVVQKRMRGMLARARVAPMLRDFRAARTVQCMVRCRLARKLREYKREYRAVTRISSRFRGNKGRARAAEKKREYMVWLKRRSDAIGVFKHRLLGMMARRKWIPLIKEFVRRQKFAIRVLQCSVRAYTAFKRVAYLRRLRDDAELRRQIAEQEAIEQAKREAVASELLQRVARGYIGRRRAFYKRVERENWEMLRAQKTPAYFRLKEDYYKGQNMLYRRQVIKIQSAFRGLVARRVTHGRRRKRACKKIEAFWHHCMQVAEAKEELRRRRESWKHRNQAATNINRVVRGFMGRYEYKKHEHALIIKWFINEVREVGMLGRALQNFRVRKRTMEKLDHQIVLTQALVRRFLTRCKFIRGYKRLVRERDARKKKRRLRACITIQGFARIIGAFNKVEIRKVQILEEQAKQQLLDDLDNRIDGIHNDHMTDLQVTRIETAARGMLGKKQYGKKEEEIKAQKAKDDVVFRGTCARQIQSMVRGVQSRVRFLLNAPQLRIDRKKRSFCVECEANVAVKKCRQCKDRYCDHCFSTIHKKGTRRKHNWEPLSSEATIHAHEEDKEDGGKGGSKGGGGGKMKKGPMINKKDWERFYDDTAKAYYWFNSASGEARWTDPMK